MCSGVSFKTPYSFRQASVDVSRLDASGKDHLAARKYLKIQSLVKKRRSSSVTGDLEVPLISSGRSVQA